jgi:hypothetical protein
MHIDVGTVCNMCVPVGSSVGSVLRIQLREVGSMSLCVNEGVGFRLRFALGFQRGPGNDDDNEDEDEPEINRPMQ